MPKISCPMQMSQMILAPPMIHSAKVPGIKNNQSLGFTMLWLKIWKFFYGLGKGHKPYILIAAFAKNAKETWHLLLKSVFDSYFLKKS